MLVKRLPPQSHFRAKVDPHAWRLAPWTTETRLLADVFDLLVAINSTKRVDPYPRPEVLNEKAAETDVRRRRLIERYEARQRRALEGGDRNV